MRWGGCVATLVLVRGMPYSGKSRWAKHQLELLVKDRPIHLFEPQNYRPWQHIGPDGRKKARMECLRATHEAFAKDRTTVCFVTDIFATECELAAYANVHAKYRLLVEVSCVPIKKLTMRSEKTFVRLNAIWDDVASLTCLDKFYSAHEINAVEQKLDTPHLQYQP